MVDRNNYRPTGNVHNTQKLIQIIYTDFELNDFMRVIKIYLKKIQIYKKNLQSGNQYDLNETTRFKVRIIIY